MSNIYYAATAENGIFQINPVKYPEIDLMDFREFMDSYSDLEAGQIIFTSAEQGDLDYYEIDSCIA